MNARLVALLIALFPVFGFADDVTDNVPDEEFDLPSCVQEKRGSGQEQWSAFTRAVPACQRAALELESGARLDLGETPEFKKFESGAIAFKATVLSGKGRYGEDIAARNLQAQVIWLSMDPCELRAQMISDRKGRDIALFRDARFLQTTRKVLVLTDGRTLEGFEGECQSLKENLQNARD